MARNYVNLAEIMGQVDNARANEANIKRQQQQMQMEDYAYQRQLKQDQEQEALKGVYSGAIDATSGEPKLNEQKLLQDLMQRGYGDQALKLQDQFKQRDLQAGKLQNETQASNLDLLSKKATYSRDMLAKTAPDGSNYPQIRQHLIETGAAGAEVLPEQYDPNAIGSLIMKADDVIKQNTPKPTEIAFTPSGVSYNKNDPSSIKLGENYGKALEPTKPDYNKPFLPDGSPNIAYQNYESTKKGEDKSGYSTKPLPPTSLKMQNETLDKLSIASNNSKKLLDIKKQIESGELKLGLVSNLKGKAKNYLGMSDESSRNLSSFKSTLEKLRNDSLRLNTGVQTDGDAQRAWNELFENINDSDLVKQRLGEIAEINTRGAELQKLQVESIRSNYNVSPIDFNKYENLQATKPPPDNPLSVLAPDGKMYTFKNKAQADGFRKSIGK